MNKKNNSRVLFTVVKKETKENVANKSNI